MKGPPKAVRVTAKLAKQWSEMERCHVDRPLQEKRLKYLTKALENHQLRTVTWARTYCKENKKVVGVNGKHTSKVLAAAELSKYGPLTAVIEDYECDTLADVAALYATFDPRESAKSSTDVNRAYSAVITDLADIDVATINLLVSGIAYRTWPVREGGGYKTSAERAELLFDHVEFCNWFVTLVPRTSACQHLRRAPVVGAMLATYEKDKADATKFWELVRDEAGAQPTDPDRRLAKFLITHRVTVGSHAGTPQRYRLSPREFYAKSLLAWNAWRRDESTNLNYVHTAANLPEPV